MKKTVNVNMTMTFVFDSENTSEGVILEDLSDQELVDLSLSIADAYISVGGDMTGEIVEAAKVNFVDLYGRKEENFTFFDLFYTDVKGDSNDDGSYDL